MLYNILPYVGAGPLRFKMTQTDACAILGKPELVRKDTDGPVELATLYWEDNGLQLIFDVKNDSLVSISFYSNIQNVILDGQTIDWDNTKDFYGHLVKADRTAKKVFGITVFFEKGVSVGSLDTDDISTKSITVFAHGQFDPDDPDFEPVSVK